MALLPYSIGLNETNPKFKPGNFGELMKKNSETKVLDFDFQESENLDSNPNNFKPRILLYASAAWREKGKRHYDKM